MLKWLYFVNTGLWIQFKTAAVQITTLNQIEASQNCTWKKNRQSQCVETERGIRTCRWRCFLICCSRVWFGAHRPRPSTSPVGTFWCPELGCSSEASLWFRLTTVWCRSWRPGQIGCCNSGKVQLAWRNTTEKRVTLMSCFSLLHKVLTCFPADQDCLLSRLITCLCQC